MRRADREVKEKKEIVSILDRSLVCRIAFTDGDTPYIVPMNFGYIWEDENPSLYFHCAKEGKKIEMLAKNNKVCFEIDICGDIINGDAPCQWSVYFESIVGEGKIYIVSEGEEKVLGMTRILKQCGYKGEPDFSDNMLKSLEILKISVSDLSCKKHIK